MYHLPASAVGQMKKRMMQAAEAALDTFLAEIQRVPQSLIVFDPKRVKSETFNPGFEWRTATLARYRAGSWKHTVIELMPFGSFRPSDFYAAHKNTLAERHPTHNHRETGLANTITELVRDGALQKIALATYAPAIDGLALLPHGPMRMMTPPDDIARLLEDPNVMDIFITSDGLLSAKTSQGAKTPPTPIAASAAELMQFVRLVAQATNRLWDEHHPDLTTSMPPWNHRLHAVFPDQIDDYPKLSIRIIFPPSEARNESSEEP